MITIGYYNTQILIDFVNYSKSTVGIELMLSDFIKYESPCCIGLYKDNNACSDGIVGIVFNRSYLYKDDNGKYHNKISENDILIDDYNKNLFEWQKAGGTSVKAKNNINHKGLHGELWKGNLIDITDTAESIVERMTKIIMSREKGFEENNYNEDDEELEID